MIEKGELATSVKEKVKTIWTMLGMTNHLTDCFYLWGVGYVGKKVLCRV